MIASIKNRLLKLEQSQPQTQTCMPLDFFYGLPAEPVPLIIGQTLSDFYNQYQNKAQNG